ncbi:MAG: class I SAM-dependent methyltransferase [Anaerolineae bacterium]|nr:class I SAM-dependent methyltransferase [Anaerolineae bacterium]
MAPSLYRRIYRKLARQPRRELPRIDLEHAFPEYDRARFHLTRLGFTLSALKLGELLYVVFLAARRPAAQVFEIGTSLGRTTLNIALCLPAGGHIYSLDLPDDAGLDAGSGLYSADQEQEVKEFVKGLYVQPYLDTLPVTLLKGESTTYDFSPWYGKMDLIFIDGGHTRRVVESDTANALKMRKPGGVILWHDYRWDRYPGIYNLLNELGKTQPLYAIEGTRLAAYIDEDSGADVAYLQRAKP